MIHTPNRQTGRDGRKERLKERKTTASKERRRETEGKKVGEDKHTKHPDTEKYITCKTFQHGRKKNADAEKYTICKTFQLGRQGMTIHR